MARGVVILVLLLSMLLGGCAAARQHPRTATVIASAAIGTVAASMMSFECTEADESCGAARTATYAGAGAIGGALLGLFIARDMRPVAPGE